MCLSGLAKLCFPKRRNLRNTSVWHNQTDFISMFSLNNLCSVLTAYKRSVCFSTKAHHKCLKITFANFILEIFSTEIRAP